MGTTLTEPRGFRPVGTWPEAPAVLPFPIEVRWFWCPRCQVLYLGTVAAERQPVSEERAAALDHEARCPGREA